ncbi:MAG: carbohydrate kinase family protein [Brevefilum sp.]|nr:carbohydrate kinase family protein [Brevefilum sp.]
MSMKQAIFAGHICLDLTPDLSAVPEGQFQHLFQPGKLIRAGGVKLSTGGSVPNTGLSMHRLGFPVRLIGKIGNDLVGRALQDIITAEGPHLADDLVIDLTLPTSFTIIINPPGFDRTFIHHPGANDTLYASDLPRVILQGADLFHFGYPPLMRSIYRNEGAELVSILQRARRAGLTTSLDYSLPDPSSPAGKVDWLTILDNTLPLVDLFVPSIEELLFLLKRETYDRLHEDASTSIIDAVEPDLLSELSEKILGYGVKALLVKLGHRGIYLRTAAETRWQKGGRGLDGLDDSWHNREIWAPAFQASVLATTGAGDAAIAGFLAGILGASSPETALKAAAAAGALSVETPDAYSGLMPWEALWARINQGWATVPLDLAHYGWRWHPTLSLWEK